MYILKICDMLDSRVNAQMVRNFTQTLIHGKGVVNVTCVGGRHANDITYVQFEALLQWLADMRVTTFADIASQIVYNSSCPTLSVLTKTRLRILFDQFATKRNGHELTAYEFARFCKAYKLYETNEFAVGDVYMMFQKVHGQKLEGSNNKSTDFDGFLWLLGKVAEKKSTSNQDLASHIMKMYDDTQNRSNGFRPQVQGADLKGGGGGATPTTPSSEAVRQLRKSLTIMSENEGRPRTFSRFRLGDEDGNPTGRPCSRSRRDSAQQGQRRRLTAKWDYESDSSENSED